MTTPTDQEDGEDEEYRAHLETIDDGCGCAAVWETLSEQRAESGDG